MKIIFLKNFHIIFIFCVVIIWLIGITGCSTIPTTPDDKKPEICKPYTDETGKTVVPKSYIYDYTKDPRLLDIGIQIGFSKSIDFLSQEKRKEVLDQTEDSCKAVKFLLVDNTLTFNVLFAYLNAEIDFINKYAGDEVVILLNDINLLNQAVPIPSCDRYLIGVNMDHIINLVKLKRIRYGLD